MNKGREPNRRRAAFVLHLMITLADPAHEFHTSRRRRVELTAEETVTVLKGHPDSTAVVAAEFFDNYDLPCPIRVDLQTTSGARQTVVLRSARTGDVVVEAAVLTALSLSGLPVPQVLTQPARLSDGRSVVVISLLPGINLQKLSMQSTEGLSKAKTLLIAAVAMLSSATGRVRADPVARLIKERTLIDEFDSVATATNPWTEEPAIRRALRLVEDRIDDFRLPLVFSNGDYQPGNFLTDGNRVTGLLDFESAAFVDPLLGLAKFPVYDLHPLSKTGLVEEFLASNKIEKSFFDLRVVLFALSVLQKNFAPVQPSSDQDGYRDRLLATVAAAADSIR